MSTARRDPCTSWVHPLVSGRRGRRRTTISFTTLRMLRGATQLQLGAFAPSLRPVDTRALDGSHAAEALSPSARAESSARRDHPVFDEVPKRDGQLSRHRDNTYLAASSATLGKARAIPSGQRTRWLVTHPCPGDLDQQGSRRFVACLADPLISLHVPARVGGRRQSQVGCQMASI